jgi:hypothetical protein
MSIDDLKNKAIKAAPNDRNCDNCIHKIGLDDINYCECWDCELEPKEKKNAG